MRKKSRLFCQLQQKNERKSAVDFRREFQPHFSII
ncbi:hypothetical protein CF65_02862 [Aggregatibacter actinomycetemcomitans HK1651]|nr:hypothetical protein CF65_02862 [Aggregatibacter actinomycetemcomitans HK1651]